MKMTICRSLILGVCYTLGFSGALFADDMMPIQRQGTHVKAEYLGSRKSCEMNRSQDIQDQDCIFNVRQGPFQGDERYSGANLLKRTSAYDPTLKFLVEGLNFEAISFRNCNSINSTPPDINGDVGECQYIYAINQSIKSFNKKTGLPDGALDSLLSGFFGVASGDPRVMYDRFAKVWYVSALAWDSAAVNNRLVFAMSHDSVITECTEWDFYLIPPTALIPDHPTTAYVDFPQLGYDEKAVYMTVNTGDNISGASYGAAVVVFQKSSLLAGNPNITIFPTFQIFSPTNPPVENLYPYLCPALNFDRCPEYGYIFATFPFLNVPVPYFIFMRIENAGSTNPTLVGPLFMPTTPYFFDDPNPHKGNLFPINNGISNTGDTPLCGVHVRHKQLYLAFVTKMDSSGTPSLAGDRTGTLWYQMDVTGDSFGAGRSVETPTTLPVVVQSGKIYDSALTSPKSYYCPAIMTNKKLDLVIHGTTSGLNDYVNMFYSARKKKDPQGTLRNPVLLTNTQYSYNFGPLSADPGQRWGDYVTVFTDPCNDVNFWLTGEYAGLPNAWSVQVIELIPTH